MTANQINYAKLKEEVRHNRVSERHEHQDVRTRRLGAQTAAYSATESARHNRETEQINWWNAREATRHNQEVESTNWFNAQESRRHNQEVEQTNWFNVRTTTAESQRHNAAMEQLEGKKLDIERDYRTAQSSALLRQATQAARANEIRSYEAETSRYNAETNRRNAETRENELAASISAVRQNVGVDYARIAESRRHNEASELETQVHNRNTEHQTSMANTFNLMEQTRHNIASEDIWSRNADIAQQNADTNRMNASTNQYNSKSQRISAMSNAWSSAINVARTLITPTGGFTYG